MHMQPGAPGEHLAVQHALVEVSQVSATIKWLVSLIHPCKHSSSVLTFGILLIIWNIGDPQFFPCIMMISKTQFEIPEVWDEKLLVKSIEIPFNAKFLQKFFRES